MGCSNFIGVAALAASSYLRKESLGIRDNKINNPDFYKNIMVKSKDKHDSSQTSAGNKHTWCHNCECYGQFSQGRNSNVSSNYTNSMEWKLDKYGNVFIYGDQQGDYSLSSNSYSKEQDGCGGRIIQSTTSDNGKTTCKTVLKENEGSLSAEYICNKQCTSTQSDGRNTYTSTNPCTPDPQTTPFYRPDGKITITDTNINFLYEQKINQKWDNDPGCYFYWGSSCGGTYNLANNTQGNSSLSNKLDDSHAEIARKASNSFRLEKIYRTNQPQSGPPFYWKCAHGYGNLPDGCWSFDITDGFIQNAFMANYNEGYSSTFAIVPFIDPNLVKGFKNLSTFKGKMYFYEAPFTYDDYGEAYLDDSIGQCNCGGKSSKNLLPVKEMSLVGSLDGPKNKAGFGNPYVAADTYVIGSEIKVDSEMFTKNRIIFTCFKDTTLDDPS